MITSVKDSITFKSTFDNGAEVVLRKAAGWLKKQKYDGSLPGFIEIQAMNYSYDSEWRVHTFAVFFERFVEDEVKV